MQGKRKVGIEDNIKSQIKSEIKNNIKSDISSNINGNIKSNIKSDMKSNTKGDIKILILDVDGTMTDGKIHMGVQGELFKSFNIKDGYGIKDMLPKVHIDWSEFNLNHSQKLQGIVPIIITARKSDIVINRCKELNIQYVYQGCVDKTKKLLEIAKEFQLKISTSGSKDNNKEEGYFKEIAYIGDDNVDIPIMKLCAIKACPADASDEVKAICDYVCTKNGGEGAVREFIDWLVKEDN